MPMLMLPILAIAIAALAYYAWLQQKRRREEMAALAAELGWRFRPDKDRGHDDEYRHFAVFRKGSNRIAYNTLRGSIDIEGREYAVKMGDFRYTIQHGKSSTTFRGSYIILHLPFVTPDLVIRREGVFDKLAGAIGFGDIDFESDAFSRQFHVSSSDKKFAYDVVHPRMMEWLMSRQVPAIDIERGQCCFADDRRSWEATDFKRWLRRADEFFGHWPEYLVKELG